MESLSNKVVYKITEGEIQSLARDNVGRYLTDKEVERLYTIMIGSPGFNKLLHTALIGVARNAIED